MSRVRFGRDPGPVRVSAVGSVDLAARLADPTADRPSLVVDLALGSCRLHHAAAELAAQLGLDEPAYDSSDVSDDPGVELARRADAETGGDRAVAEALDWADRVADRTGVDPVTVWVLWPRAGAVIERQDLAFLRFLHGGLRSPGQELVIVRAGAGSASVPPDWTAIDAAQRTGPAPLRPVLDGPAARYPGVIRPEHADTVGRRFDLSPLAGGCRLVDPDQRPTGAGGAADEAAYAELARALEGCEWAVAYALARAGRDRIDPWRVWRQASLEFRSGGCEIPLALLERAEQAVDSPSKIALIRVLAQAVRLFNQRFADAAGVPAPAERLPAPMRGALLASRGWALTMLGRPEEAEDQLALARQALFSDPPSDQYLSLLNISALNRLRLGDDTGAAVLEGFIRDELDDRSPTRWQFGYVNALNLCRLARRAGDHEAAESYREDAFATTAGVAVESDALHAATLRALIAGDAGRTDIAHQAWVRAAVIWAASGSPEAIAPRVTRLIVGRGQDPGSVITDAVADQLTRRLALPGVDSVADDRDESPGEAPVFITPQRVDLDLSRLTWSPVSMAGVMVLVAEWSTEPTLCSRADVRLRSRLGRLLGGAADRVASTGPLTVLVDGPLGKGVATTPEQLVETCLRHGITTLTHDDERLDLGGDTWDELLDDLVVTLGDGVRQVREEDDGTWVTFRRYRPAYRLELGAPRLLRRVVVGPRTASEPVLAGSFDADERFQLWSLERERVIALRLRPTSVAPAVQTVRRWLLAGPPCSHDG